MRLTVKGHMYVCSLIFKSHLNVVLFSKRQKMRFNIKCHIFCRYFSDDSTDRPCARDMCNTARSFKHESRTCVIWRFAFLNLCFIVLLSCTRSLPPSTTTHQRILVCPRTSKSWDCFGRSLRFPNDCAAVRRLGNRGCSKKSTKN